MMVLPKRRNGYLATWCNQVIDTLWRMRVLSSQDVAVDEMPDGVRLRVNWKSQTLSGTSFPWGENYTFGITDTSAEGVYKLKVWLGKFRRWGDQTYTAADTEVTFSGDGDQYIVWRWSEADGLEIVDEPQVNYPAESDSTYIYGAVHKVNLTAGKFTLLESIQTGIINAPIFSAAGV
jgi:hypothetical protein